MCFFFVHGERFQCFCHRFRIIESDWSFQYHLSGRYIWLIFLLHILTWVKTNQVRRIWANRLAVFFLKVNVENSHSAWTRCWRLPEARLDVTDQGLFTGGAETLGKHVQATMHSLPEDASEGRDRSVALEFEVEPISIRKSSPIVNASISRPGSSTIRPSRMRLPGCCGTGPGRDVALIWIDLVNLRREFSLWGWTGAEALARRVAGTLRSVVDADALLGRVGGRSFLVAMEVSKHDKAGAPANSERLWMRYARLRNRGWKRAPGGSGSGFLSRRYRIVEDLVRFASLAAKRAGHVKSQRSSPSIRG